MKINYLLRQNIDALLTGRGQHRKDLAMFCRRSESWVSQIFTKPDRNIPLKYLDRIAAFFGITAYQLLQPGISPLTERRKVRDRRSGVDRRVNRVADLLEPVPSFAALEQEIRRLPEEEYRRFVRRALGALALTDPPRGSGGPLGPEESTGPPPAPTTRTRERRQ